jgi:hypothetical protein
MNNGYCAVIRDKLFTCTCFLLYCISHHLMKDIVLIEISIIIIYSLQYIMVSSFTEMYPRLNIVTIPELKTTGEKKNEKERDNGRGLARVRISKRKISQVKSSGNSFAPRFHLLLPQLVV